jgi:hypothetical protein
MGSVLHLALGVPLDANTYSQDNINYLQESLNSVFSVVQNELEYFPDPKESLLQSFCESGFNFASQPGWCPEDVA